ncbi:MAG TPA: glucose 1-dehydrogenase [Nitrolancea sp.]|nr:glucose 1-dehydrogenase [Nitrolancea sp.]
MALPSFRLDGQVAVVTGTGTGLGQAIAAGLAEAGADVVMSELPDRVHLAEKTARSISNHGRDALVLPLDVRDLDGAHGIRAFAHAAINWRAHVDILVNNAGINLPQDALDVDEATWDAVLDIDLKGTFFCAQAFGRHMVERGHGTIINIASQNGLVGYYKRAAYCSAKAGVVNLTRVLTLEWAPRGVRVNAIAPTFVRTPLTASTFDDPELGPDLIRRIPLGRIGEPEDVAAAVVFLASPAASMITGHTLTVDGGWTAI